MTPTSVSIPETTFKLPSSEIRNNVALQNRIWQGIFAYLSMYHVHLGTCLSWHAACKTDMRVFCLNCTSSWPSVFILCSLVLRWVTKGLLPERRIYWLKFYRSLSSVQGHSVFSFRVHIMAYLWSMFVKLLWIWEGWQALENRIGVKSYLEK